MGQAFITRRGGGSKMVTGTTTAVYNTSTADYHFELPDCVGLTNFLIVVYPSSTLTLYSDYISNSTTSYGDAVLYKIDLTAGTCVYQRNRFYCYPKSSNTQVQVYLETITSSTVPTFSSDGVLDNLPDRPASTTCLYMAW